MDDQKGGDPMDIVVWADWLLQMWGRKKTDRMKTNLLSGY